jgi:hypothetical protein
VITSHADISYEQSWNVIIDFDNLDNINIRGIQNRGRCRQVVAIWRSLTICEKCSNDRTLAKSCIAKTHLQILFLYKDLAFSISDFTLN